MNHSVQYTRHGAECKGASARCVFDSVVRGARFSSSGTTAVQHTTAELADLFRSALSSHLRRPTWVATRPLQPDSLQVPLRGGGRASRTLMPARRLDKVPFSRRWPLPM